MANADTPRGFWPIRHLSGGTIRANKYTIASAYATNIFPGDVVKLVAGGGIEAAAAGNRLLGVFQGVKYTAADGSQVYAKYWPASTVATDIEATVYDDPNILFGAQSSGITSRVRAARPLVSLPMKSMVRPLRAQQGFVSSTRSTNPTMPGERTFFWFVKHISMSSMNTLMLMAPQEYSE